MRYFKNNLRVLYCTLYRYKRNFPRNNKLTKFLSEICARVFVSLDGVNFCYQLLIFLKFFWSRKSRTYLRKILNVIFIMRTINIHKSLLNVSVHGNSIINVDKMIFCNVWLRLRTTTDYR